MPRLNVRHATHWPCWLLDSCCSPRREHPDSRATGTTLWRVSPATDADNAPALALGPAAATVNPAQTDDSARLQLALEAIQTPASGRCHGNHRGGSHPCGSNRQLGLLYGRVGLSDITQTIDSPDPTGDVRPVYSSRWARRGRGLVGGTSVRPTLALSRDASRRRPWGPVDIDVGAGRLLFGDRLARGRRTHFFFVAQDE